MSVRAAGSLLAHIEAKRSRYGCGADDCVNCSPLQYECYDCTHRFRMPVIRTQFDICYLCESCFDIGLGYAKLVKGENPE